MGNVLLCKTLTFDGVCGIIFFIILLAHLFAITVPTCWNNCYNNGWWYCQFLLVVTDVIATGLEPLRCFDGRCFYNCGCILAIFEMADGIAIVADGIATFVMTDVIVIVEME